MTTSDDQKPDSAPKPLPKIHKIGTPPFGFGSDIGLGFAHNFSLDIAREVLGELPTDKWEDLYQDLMAVFNQWKKENGRLRQPPTSLLTMFGGQQEHKRELTEAERLIQISSLEPWQCHPSATTPISLFNQLYYEEYKPLKAYLDSNNWARYHYIQAILILISHEPDNEYQVSDCIYEATKLALWHLKRKNGLIEAIMPDAMAMWNARRKSKAARKEKKRQKETDIDSKVSAVYGSICKDGKAPSAIQRHIQRETGLNQTEVSRSMARLGLSTRKKKELQK